MKTTFGVLAVLFVFAGTTLADSLPTRTRSSYGNAASTILSTSTQTTNGVTINSQEFCSDAITNSDGTCQLAFAFQITSTLPANATSLTLTFPIPSGSSLLPSGVGILTNDSPISGGNIFFSPNISSLDVLNLPNSTLVAGVDASGNPTLTLPVPFPITGGLTNLSLFMNVSDNNSLHGDGLYCFQVVAGGCTATDVPAIPTLGVNLTTTTGTVPEPASLSLLASGLLGLAFLRRTRKHS